MNSLSWLIHFLQGPAQKRISNSIPLDGALFVEHQFCRSLNKEVEIYSSEQLEMIWQLSTGQLLPKILQKCLTQQKRAKLITEIPRPVFFIAAMAARKNVLFQIIFLRRVFKLLLLFKLCLMEKCL